jgi:hypothetical protein
VKLSLSLTKRGFESRQELRIFLFTTRSRLALGPTQPPIQWLQMALSLEVKRSRREADHSHPSSDEVKKCMELYIYSPTASSWRGAPSSTTGTTLPFTFFLLLPLDEEVWRSRLELHAFVTSTLGEGEWSALRSSHCNSRERVPGHHWIGCWVGPRAGLDAVAKRKISSLFRESNSGHVARNLVTVLTELSLLLGRRLGECI